ncbi:MAG: hypothetical protein Kow00104_13590 [Rhodothalassiaceae bacterium]
MRDDLARLAGLAMARLGWSADLFWQATPAELHQAACGLMRRDGLKPMGRSEFETLLARFPD